MARWRAMHGIVTQSINRNVFCTAWLRQLGRNQWS
jgi:hypothetical protein